MKERSPEGGIGILEVSEGYNMNLERFDGICVNIECLEGFGVKR
jgi:hypothetical protein